MYGKLDSVFAFIWAGLGLGAIVSLMAVPTVRPTKSNTVTYGDGPMYITAAHLPAEDFPYLTQVYVDDARDTAYYLRNNYDYFVPEVGSSVYINGKQCIVDNIVPDMGYYVKVPNTLPVYQGMSGMRVYDDNNVAIAFVSQLKGKNYLLCIPIV